MNRKLRSRNVRIVKIPSDDSEIDNVISSDEENIRIESNDDSFSSDSDDSKYSSPGLLER